MPVEALVEAALSETDPNVAGALRWALAQSGDDGLALLAEGLGSPVAEVRKRAVQSIAEIPGGDADRAAARRPARTPTSWSAGTRLWRSGPVAWPTPSRRSST